MTNSLLVSLNLMNNNIGDEGAKVLSQLLRRNTALRWLDLSYNGLSPTGASHIALALKSNVVLKSVRIESEVPWRLCLTAASLDAQAVGLKAGIRLSTEDSIVFAAALSSNTEITQLKLLHVASGPNVAMIAKSLRQVSSLKSLDLSGTYCP